MKKKQLIFWLFLLLFVLIIIIFFIEKNKEGIISSNLILNGNFDSGIVNGAYDPVTSKWYIENGKANTTGFYPQIGKTGRWFDTYYNGEYPTGINTCAAFQVARANNYSQSICQDVNIEVGIYFLTFSYTGAISYYNGETYDYFPIKSSGLSVPLTVSIDNTVIGTFNCSRNWLTSTNPYNSSTSGQKKIKFTLTTPSNYGGNDSIWFLTNVSLVKLSGEQGLQGERGQDGQQGPDGPTGLTGPIGLKGLTGDIGPVGKTGPSTLKGEKGDKGNKGETGEKGDKGDSGTSGTQGQQGQQGPQGQQGRQGRQGPQGIPGIQGNLGPEGPQGDVGLNPIPPPFLIEYLKPPFYTELKELSPEIMVYWNNAMKKLQN